ncbi:homeobox-leucine zipper protein ROC8 [Ziziphus jujuba]|uniref:Homeobox-leucine zipper protein ROC8 n=1 Tax=Ziziphus jujuba TaxID=326968 RepID=A0ABM3IHI2_ZIZJJ|nr:homeobox-leucine zipper protein ROC8 [Ziziphus jujuba]
MEFAVGCVGDEHDASSSRKGKKSYHRHTVQQIQHLEAFFKECPHPDENQRRQLSRELSLETKQIKFWFQNKRTQTKAQNERADNTVLRAENERIQCENLAIREALKNVICPSCGGPPFGEEERQRSLQKLQLENAQLKEEHEKVSNLLAKYIGKPISQIESLAAAQGLTVDLDLGGSSLNQGIGGPGLDLDLTSGGGFASNRAFPYHFRAIPDMEKTLMAETAASAMEELVKLLRIDDPLWVQSPVDGRCTIHRDSYEKIFPRSNHFKTSSARMESSKDSGMVIMNAMQLVDMFMDTSKWLDLFPTLITDSKTIQVLEPGMLGNKNGALLLMYEQMHILSPLVAQREYYILRHCQQIEPGVWVIANVSYDCSINESVSPLRSWKLPSGCMIQEISNGCSKVTWVEHVEVDDKTQTHRLYRDLVCSSIAYGAERWIVTLQKMCERIACSLAESSPPCEFGVITLPEGRKSIMKLSHRMVKNFCAILSMSGKMDFPQLSEVNNSGVRVSVRNNTEPGQPIGTIVSAATSLWLPLPPQNVFDFFKDGKTRVQWDVLSNGNPVHEIAHISIGTHPGNCITIIRPFIPTENNILMLQESCIDSLGSMVIYAPIDIPALNVAISGEDSSTIPILPSGFIVSNDGRTTDHDAAITGSSASTSSNTNGRSGGSLLTVAFQILVSSPSSSKQLNMESVATVNTLISSTVQKIKVALNCSTLD